MLISSAPSCVTYALFFRSFSRVLYTSLAFFHVLLTHFSSILSCTSLPILLACFNHFSSTPFCVSYAHLFCPLFVLCTSLPLFRACLLHFSSAPCVSYALLFHSFLRILSTSLPLLFACLMHFLSAPCMSYSTLSHSFLRLLCQEVHSWFQMWELWNLRFTAYSQLKRRLSGYTSLTLSLQFYNSTSRLQKNWLYLHCLGACSHRPSLLSQLFDCCKCSSCFLSVCHSCFNNCYIHIWY